MVPRESDFADDADPYERIYEMCQLAEELGYDFATFTHHRFSAERPHLSSPLVLMSAIAARTTRLQLITTIFILPLYHPLEVAESVASLDNVSGGRVILGVGSGYREYEAAAVGVPFHRRISRMTESIEIVQRAWTEGAFSFQGQHFTFEDVDVFPKPTQRPRPPIWIGALERKPVERAGRIADGWIAPYLQSLETLKGRADAYRSVAHGAGRGSTICLERDVAISLDAGAARAAWLDRNLELIRYFSSHGASMPDLDLADQSFGGVAPGRAVAGNPDDCIRALKQCEETLDPEYLSVMNTGLGPGYGHRGNYDPELAGLRLFGQEVIPAFA
jgi:probable F420-dependent oxidoreductase